MFLTTSEILHEVFLMLSKTQTNSCLEKSIGSIEKLVLFDRAVFFKKIFHSFALLIVKLLFGIPSIPFPNSTPLETVLKETSLSFKVFVLVDLQPWLQINQYKHFKA